MAIKLVLFSGPASARSHKTLLLRPLGKQLMPLYDILHEWLHLVASNLPANQSMSKLLLMARVSASEFLRAKGRSEIETECDTSQPWPSDVTYQRVAAIELNSMLANGRYKPLIGARLSLSDAAKAHQLQEDNTLNSAGSLTGKIVLKP
jgi:NADPH:quinone reductase-like Zn-dependent oxidoreductase